MKKSHIFGHISTSKFFIATDERCGCTEFTRAFAACGLSFIEDPQSILGTKEHYLYEELSAIAGTTDRKDIGTWAPTVFNHYGTIKACFASFSPEDYIYLLEHSLNRQINVIVVWRNPFKRALSLLMAYAITKQIRELKSMSLISSDHAWADGYSNILLEQYKSFTIDTAALRSKIDSYYTYTHNVCDYLDSLDANYFFLEVDKLHQNPANGYATIFNSLGLDIINPRILDEAIAYKAANKKSLVANLDELASYSKFKYLLPKLERARILL